MTIATENGQQRVEKERSRSTEVASAADSEDTEAANDELLQVNN
jgi:hypothetical protein